LGYLPDDSIPFFVQSLGNNSYTLISNTEGLSIQQGLILERDGAVACTSDL